MFERFHHNFLNDYEKMDNKNSVRNDNIRILSKNSKEENQDKKM